MKEIRISDVRAEEKTIRATIEYSRELFRFFDDETFFVEYDVDITTVPEAVLTIPVLAQVCPVAWATGTDVHVEIADEQYLQSLERVGTVLGEMYPEFIEGGRVIVDEARPMSDWKLDGRTNAETNTGDDSPDAAMLFTGGVDSVSTYIRHREKNPTLINVQGWTVGIDEDERWRRTKRDIEEYGDRFGVPTQFIRSNMLSVLDWRMLIAHFNQYYIGGWYSAVACGLGLSGLCAPLTVAEGYNRLYMAATVWETVDPPEVVDHWDGRGVPWGSHPRIVDNIRWGDTESIHDGYELSRQEKVELLADFLSESGQSDLLIRSCNHDESGENCNQCEKCFRTAFGLALEGINPNDHGFRLTPEYFDRAKDGLRSGRWVDNENGIFWREFQDHEGHEEYPIKGTKDFYEWFQSFDIDAANASTTPPLQQRVIRTALRNMPYPVYKTADTVYGTLENRIE